MLDGPGSVRRWPGVDATAAPGGLSTTLGARARASTHERLTVDRSSPQRAPNDSIDRAGHPAARADRASRSTEPSGYRYRSRKSWAVLAFLLLGERPPTRSQARLAALRRGRRPAARAALEPGRDPPGARTRRRAGRRSGAAHAARRDDGRRRRAGRTVTGRTPSTCPGSAPTSSTGRHPERRALRVLAAVRNADDWPRRRSRSCTRPHWGFWPGGSSNGPATWPSGRPS